MLEKVRRRIALFLALTMVVAGAAQIVQASDMAVKMSVAASAGDMPMTGGCSGCSDDDGTSMACVAICGSAMAAILPTAPFVAPVALVPPTAAFGITVAGHHGPPDPYPPRPASLD